MSCNNSETRDVIEAVLRNKLGGAQYQDTFDKLLRLFKELKQSIVLKNAERNAFLLFRTKYDCVLGQLNKACFLIKAYNRLQQCIENLKTNIYVEPSTTEEWRIYVNLTEDERNAQSKAKIEYRKLNDLYISARQSYEVALTGQKFLTIL